MSTIIAQTSEPPYYAVSLISKLSDNDLSDYEQTMEKIFELAIKVPGYLGIESVRNNEGNGITIAYYKDLESIDTWRKNIDHKKAKKRGRESWYSTYKLRISKVESEYPTFVSEDNL